jgi:hypothetical protein
VLGHPHVAQAFSDPAIQQALMQYAQQQAQQPQGQPPLRFADGGTTTQSPSTGMDSNALAMQHDRDIINSTDPNVTTAQRQQARMDLATRSMAQSGAIPGASQQTMQGLMQLAAAGPPTLGNTLAAAGLSGLMGAGAFRNTPGGPRAAGLAGAAAGAILGGAGNFFIRKYMAPKKKQPGEGGGGGGGGGAGSGGGGGGGGGTQAPSGTPQVQMFNGVPYQYNSDSGRWQPVKATPTTPATPVTPATPAGAGATPPGAGAATPFPVASFNLPQPPLATPTPPPAAPTSNAPGSTDATPNAPTGTATGSPSVGTGGLRTGLDLRGNNVYSLNGGPWTNAQTGLAVDDRGAPIDPGGVTGITQSVPGMAGGGEVHGDAAQDRRQMLGILKEKGLVKRQFAEGGTAPVAHKPLKAVLVRKPMGHPPGHSMPIPVISTTIVITKHKPKGRKPVTKKRGGPIKPEALPPRKGPGNGGDWPPSPFKKGGHVQVPRGFGAAKRGKRFSGIY